MIREMIIATNRKNYRNIPIDVFVGDVDVMVDEARKWIPVLYDSIDAGIDEIYSGYNFRKPNSFDHSIKTSDTSMIEEEYRMMNQLKHHVNMGFESIPYIDRPSHIKKWIAGNMDFVRKHVEFLNWKKFVGLNTMGPTFPRYAIRVRGSIVHHYKNGYKISIDWSNQTKLTLLASSIRTANGGMEFKKRDKCRMILFLDDDNNAWVRLELLGDKKFHRIASFSSDLSLEYATINREPTGPRRTPIFEDLRQHAIIQSMDLLDGMTIRSLYHRAIETLINGYHPVIFSGTPNGFHHWCGMTYFYRMCESVFDVCGVEFSRFKNRNVWKYCGECGNKLESDSTFFERFFPCDYRSRKILHTVGFYQTLPPSINSICVIYRKLFGR